MHAQTLHVAHAGDFYLTSAALKVRKKRRIRAFQVAEPHVQMVDHIRQCFIRQSLRKFN